MSRCRQSTRRPSHCSSSCSRIQLTSKMFSHHEHDPPAASAKALATLRDSALDRQKHRGCRRVTVLTWLVERGVQASQPRE